VGLFLDGANRVGCWVTWYRRWYQGFERQRGRTSIAPDNHRSRAWPCSGAGGHASDDQCDGHIRRGVRHRRRASSRAARPLGDAPILTGCDRPPSGADKAEVHRGRSPLRGSAVATGQVLVWHRLDVAFPAAAQRALDLVAGQAVVGRGRGGVGRVDRLNPGPRRRARQVIHDRNVCGSWTEPSGTLLSGPDNRTRPSARRTTSCRPRGTPSSRQALGLAGPTRRHRCR
jgi:hypothetical protein